MVVLLRMPGASRSSGTVKVGDVDSGDGKDDGLHEEVCTDETEKIAL